MDIPVEPRKKRGRYFLVAGAVVVLAAVTVALARLEPAAPSVDRATLYIDSVVRGDLPRNVRAPGTLVPEQIRHVTAVTAGRLERIHVQPGEEVGPETVLMELNNPSVQMEALEAERALAAAQAQLVSLRSTLETQRLTQEAMVAQIRREYQDARRQAAANRELAEKNLIARNALEQSDELEAELRERVAINEEQLEVLATSVEAQIGAQENQVSRAEETLAFQRERAASMQVTAGAPGVVQDVPFEVGQWAIEGAELSQVVQPGRLKAELRVPETQARDVVIGLKAVIDTRNGLINGTVTRIDPAVQAGTVTVDVALQGEYPQGARPDLSVDGTIQIELLEDVIHMGRPSWGERGGRIGIFKLDEGGGHASRVYVQLGQTSVSAVEIRDGLQPGDVVILSDMSQYDGYDRVRIN